MILGLMALFVIVLSVYPVSAANPHPGGSGQPSQSCQDFFANGQLIPSGFNTDGFNLTAINVYAGAGHSLISGNPNAVSQYDVACFQQSVRMSR